MPDVLTVREAASEIGVSVWRVYQLIKAGQLEATKSGGIWLVLTSSVEWRKSQKAKKQAKGS